MIINGDCLEEMRKMEANSISAIVTDPPYGLHFMGKDWDYGIPGIEFWKEMLRISKPGSFLLSFGGTRTYHRLACAIEDAGWEIRDCLSWLYGQGFPKSHNHFGIEGYGTALKPAWEPIIFGQKPYEITQLFAIISYDLTNEIHRNICQRSNANVSDAEKNLKDSQVLLNKVLPFTVQENVIMFAWEKLADANYVAKNTTEPEQDLNSANLSFAQEHANTNGCKEDPLANLILAGGVDAIFANIQDIYMSVITNDISENIALLWRNTLENLLREMNRFTIRMVLRLIIELRTLKSCLFPNISKDIGSLFPNWEPIIMAMKPCEGTFKENAEKWGQAGINIDGCRIPGESWGSRPAIKLTSKGKVGGGFGQTQWESKPGINEDKGKGRWPANLILDEEAGTILDEQSGVLKSGKLNPYKSTCNLKERGWGFSQERNYTSSSNKGGASRFFYCAKASPGERNEGLDKFYSIEYNLSEIFGGLCEESTEQALLLIKVISDLAAMNLSIEEFGEKLLVKFPKECLSIIKMVINRITDLKIWNLLMHSPTKEFIQDVFAEKMDGISPVLFAMNTSEWMNKIGIFQEMVGFLTIDVKNVILKLLLKIKEEESWKNNKNVHPTIKPLRLMEYLIKLVMPRSDGLLLDPFAGSGTTILAAKRLGFKAIGIEKDPGYAEIAEKRIAA